MSFKDTLKNFIGIPEEDYYDDEDIDTLSDRGERGSDRNSMNIDQELGSMGDGFMSANSDRRNKVVNIHATTQLQVVLVKPERYEDATGIADNLNNKRTVVLNLESTNKDVSRRLLDFLCGAAYANNGQVKRVANSTYIITPCNVNIMGDLLDELESSGVIF